MMLLAVLEKSTHFGSHKISFYSYSEELVAKRLEIIDADKNQLQKMQYYMRYLLINDSCS